MSALLPDSDYLAALGKANYCLAYTEWLVIEVTQRLDQSVDLNWLAPRTMGKIATHFVTAVERSTGLELALKSELSEIAREWRDLVAPRNDIAHARPATTPDGRQRLYRWAPKVTARFITEEVLAEISNRALDIWRRLSPLRERLPD